MATAFREPTQGKFLTYVIAPGDAIHTPGAICLICDELGYPQPDNCDKGHLHAERNAQGLHRACDYCGTDE